MTYFAQNIILFAQSLRRAGLKIGINAPLEALDAIDRHVLYSKQTFYGALAAIFLKNQEDRAVFNAVFNLFWRKQNYPLTALAPGAPEPKNDVPGQLRAALAMGKTKFPVYPPISPDRRLGYCPNERLAAKDFDQMTSEELADANQQIAKLTILNHRLATRRYRSSNLGQKFDPKRSIKISMRQGGELTRLCHRAPKQMYCPITAICDISGSMGTYTRLFLRFLHALSQQNKVNAFLFATRLSNISRALKNHDPDQALNLCSNEVQDWEGGTRIASCLSDFNREWSRRVLSSNTIVLLLSDGLERDHDDGFNLANEVTRLRLSCRRLIWLNPLVRYHNFEPKARGIKIIADRVDVLRPIHCLDSLTSLVSAINGVNQLPRRI